MRLLLKLRSFNFTLKFRSSNELCNIRLTENLFHSPFIATEILQRVVSCDSLSRLASVAGGFVRRQKKKKKSKMRAKRMGRG